MPNSHVYIESALIVALDRRLSRLETIVDDIRQRAIKIERDLRLHWWAFGILLAMQAAILIRLFQAIPK